MAKDSRGFRRFLLSTVALCAPMVATTSHGAVGRTTGDFEVTATGGATYSIPIYAMPGPRGMQPSIELVYSSNSEIGIVGKGWSLAGYGAISRCRKTLAQDGAPGTVSLAATDGYCFNGNRLLKTSGTYGTGGSTYQTEIADFSRYTATGTQGNGPASFAVRAKNGIDYDYGTDGNSAVLATGTSTVHTWLLREMRDRNNNRVRFTYAAPDTGTTGTTHPTLIEWTATSHDASTFQYSISFEYIPNAPESSYYGLVAGTAVSDDDLLDTITVRDGTNVVRKYKLEYLDAPTTGVKRLWRITECSDGWPGDCLAPTTFSYQDGQVGVGGGAQYGSAWSAQDINGDGFPDTLFKSGNQWRVTWGTQSGGGGDTVTVATTSSLAIAMAGDVRGVGQADVLVAQGSVWWAYRWNAGIFTATSTGAPVSTYPGYNNFGDANGDGRRDLLYFSPGGVDYRLSTSSASTVSFGSATNAMSTCWGGPCYFYDFGWDHTFDYNGDGKVDFITTYEEDPCYPDYPECYGVYATSGYGIFASQPSGGYSYIGGQTFEGPLSQLQLKAVRANDDDCTDLISQGSYWYWNYGAVNLSSCVGAPLPPIVAAGNIRTVVDWDGDGRRDLLIWAGGSTLSVMRSLGNSYAAPVATGLPNDVNACTWVALDRNGDGLEDLECRGPTTSYSYLHNGAGVKADLATGFTDGFGVAQTVSYVSATWGNYIKQADAVTPAYDYVGPLQLVASVAASDGIGGTYTLSYSYYGAAKDRERRQYLGLAARKETDSRTGIYRIERYKREFPYSGSLYQTEIYQPGGTLISQSTRLLGWGLAGNAGYYIPPGVTTTLRYGVGGSSNGVLMEQITETIDWDQWGNTISTSTDVLNGNPSSPYFSYGHSTFTTFSSPDTGPNWCLGLPGDTDEWHSISEPGNYSAVTVHTAHPQIDYVKCRVEGEWSSTPINQYFEYSYLNKSFGFDTFGNVNSITVSGSMTSMPATPPRTHQIQWGSANGTVGGTGQFPVSETNALGQTTTRTFHSAFGSLLTETDPNTIVRSGPR